MKQPAALLPVLFAILLCSAVTASQAPKSAPPPPVAASAPEPKVIEPPHEITAADVGAFLDGFMPMQLERENIAGAVVLVVKDGRVLFAKGYGYSDVDKKIPVSVDSTLFRPGSISKLFTWTAVMQLVEQGKLDLDRDVNTYLDFRIPETFPQPITLRNIMTHTPGFEEQVKDLINREGDTMSTLREHLIRHMPERVFAPGTTPAYSNYGASLAGYIVERVSQRPFSDYVEENIFKPLGMTRSTFAQPLPAELKPLMSRGYNAGSGKAKPFEMIEEAPAGALSATAQDMSRFMIAHLQEGTLDNEHILRPETARMMHSRQFGLVPELNGMCMGFYEESRNGHRIIGHGGDTFYFHSDLHLMPDAKLGFFVSYNSAGKGDISPRTALWNHFLDRYFPYTPPAAPRLASAATDAKIVAGRYMSTRRSQTNFLKVTAMQGESTVRPAEKDSDGDLKIDGSKDFSGEVKKWQEIAPFLYRAVNGQDMLAFRHDEHGRLQLVPNFPIVVSQRVSLLQDQKFNLPLIIGCLAIMGLTLVFWPVGALIRRHYRQRLEMDNTQRRDRLWIRLVCALNIVFILAMLQTFSHIDPGTLSERLDLRVNLIQVVGLLGVLGTVPVLLACWRSLRDPDLWVWAKIWNLLVLLASIGFSWFVIYWKLLDFNRNY